MQQLRVEPKDLFVLLFPNQNNLLTHQHKTDTSRFQHFVKQQLPSKLNMVRKIDQNFLQFQLQYTNLLVKRPCFDRLIHDFLLKVTNRTQKYFNSLHLQVQKVEASYLLKQFSIMNLIDIRETFKRSLKHIQIQLYQKYFSNSYLDREKEIEITKKLYNLLEMYHYTKCDMTTVAAHFQINQEKVLDTINNKSMQFHQSTLFGDLFYLSPQFQQYIHNITVVRASPFVNKKDFLRKKTDQILKQVQSYHGSNNLQIMVDSIVRKQKIRVSKDFYNDLLKQFKLKDIDKMQNNESNKQLTKQYQQLKKDYAQIKNNYYYYEIIKPTFLDLYKIEFNKLENLYYIAGLEKYLQTIQTILERLLVLEQRLIYNSKEYIKNFGHQISQIIMSLCHKYQSRNTNFGGLKRIIQTGFNDIQHLLSHIACPQKNHHHHEEHSFPKENSLHHEGNSHQHKGNDHQNIHDHQENSHHLYHEQKNHQHHHHEENRHHHHEENRHHHGAKIHHCHHKEGNFHHHHQDNHQHLHYHEGNQQLSENLLNNYLINNQRARQLRNKQILNNYPINNDQYRHQRSQRLAESLLSKIKNQQYYLYPY